MKKNQTKLWLVLTPQYEIAHIGVSRERARDFRYLGDKIISMPLTKTQLKTIATGFHSL